MKKKILFVQPTNSTFMQIDYKILSSEHTVDKIILHQNSKLKYAYNMLIMLKNALITNQYDYYVCWFADYHAFVLAIINKLLKKKLIILIGGCEAYYYPKLHLGLHGNRFRSWCVKLALEHSNIIVANHESLIASTHYFYYNDGHKDGIKSIFPAIKTPFTVIFNGFAPPIPNQAHLDKENLVLTVGTTPTWYDVINKGYDLLVEAAREFPALNFIFVGLQDKWLDRFSELTSYRELSNITIYPFLTHELLFDLYIKSRIYLQPSIIEGMPNALLEAMFFNCIPIGSNVAGIPTVIGYCGIILNSRDKTTLISAISHALTLPTTDLPRQRILAEFSFETRKKAMLELIY